MALRSSPAWLVSVCLDSMSGRGKKSKHLLNGDAEYQFKVFSDNTPGIIKLHIHDLWEFEAYFRKLLEHIQENVKWDP